MSAVQNSFAESYNFITIEPGYYKIEGSDSADHDAGYGVDKKFDAQITPINQIQWVLWKIAAQKNTENLPQFRENDGEGDHTVFTHDNVDYELNYDHPAENLTHNEFVEFRDWLNNQPEVIYSPCKFEIFTEEQWAWMAYSAAPEELKIKRLFAHVDIRKYAFFSNNSGGRTHRLNLLKPLTNGLRHVFGNVWEHTTSTYSRSRFVIRGGGWNLSVQDLFSELRSGLEPSQRNSYVGGRLVRTCE